MSIASSPAYAARLAQAAPSLARMSLGPNVTKDALNEAYRSLAKQAHPDHGGDLQDFLQLQTDFETISQLLADFGPRPFASLDPTSGVGPQGIGADAAAAGAFPSVPLPNDSLIPSAWHIGAVATLLLMLIAGIWGFTSWNSNKTPSLGHDSDASSAGEIDEYAADMSGMEQISDEQLRQIVRHPGLRSLNLSNSQVSYSNLQTLGAAKGLWELDLSYTNVGDTIWAVLAKFPSLQTLKLDGNTKLSADRLASFLAGKPDLRLVSVADTNLMSPALEPYAEQGLLVWSPRKLASPSASQPTQDDALVDPALSTASAESTSPPPRTQSAAAGPLSAEAAIASELDSLTQSLDELQEADALGEGALRPLAGLRRFRGLEPPRNFSADANIDVRELTKRNFGPRTSVQRRLPDLRGGAQGYWANDLGSRYPTQSRMRDALVEPRRSEYDGARRNPAAASTRVYESLREANENSAEGGSPFLGDYRQIPGAPTTTLRIPSGGIVAPYLAPLPGAYSVPALNERYSILPNRGK